MVGGQFTPASMVNLNWPRVVNLTGVSIGDPIDILIEAYSGDKLVGEAASSSEVNSTTKYVEVIPGQSIRITLAMDDDFEGEFKVIAKDPATGVILSEINLETDYL